MELPIKVFWGLNRNIDRLAAQQDIRSLNVGLAAQSGEARETLINRLIKAVGDPVQVNEAKAAIVNAKFDREGFDELKALSARLA